MRNEKQKIETKTQIIPAAKKCKLSSKPAEANRNVTEVQLKSCAHRETAYALTALRFVTAAVSGQVSAADSVNTASVTVT